jgi:hypothetical protein
MKIAIFADSHGDCQYLWKDQNVTMGPGWPELLEATRGKDVVNFSKAGSGTFYSYQLFLKQHSKFDKVIFVPSQHGRFDLQLTTHVQQIIPGFVHTLEPTLAQLPKHSPDYKILSAAIDYCQYVMDQVREQVFNKLLISDIMNVRPDAIIIHAFSYPGVKQPIDCIPLTEVSEIEMGRMRVNRQELRKGPPMWDIRKCHISEEHNDILYKKILHAIDNNQQFVYFTPDDIVSPIKPSSYYFTPTSNGLPGNV